MAVDMFLKIDGIPGESTDHKHKDEIEVLSWSWGVTQTGLSGGGGGGAGKAQPSEFVIVKTLDKASPLLMESCCTGKHISDVTLTIASKKLQVDFYKVKLEDCLISSYQTGGSGAAGAVPADQISFNFQRMSIEATGRSGPTSVSCNFGGLTKEVIGHNHGD